MRRRGRDRASSRAVGVATVALTAMALVLAFTKELPWGKEYELKAVFSNVQGLTTRTPVRIAGVDVGRVVEVEHLAPGGSAPGNPRNNPGAPPPDPRGAGRALAGARRPASPAVVVTMQIESEGLPIHADATMRLRPRLFLEGNYFVDLRPGSPSAPEAENGHVLPVTNTSYPVQLDQVLTTLQSDVRDDLRTTLDQLGNALVKHGGARGFQRLFRSSPGAYRSTAQVNQALLGTEPHDLSELVANLDATVAALDRHEPQLQELVGNLRAATGSLAAESRALERSVGELPATIDAARPMLGALNRSFPAARAFAREALGGVEALPPALDAGTPLLRQLRGLLSRRELRGAARDLRPAVPRLASLTRRTVPFLGEARALSSCFNETVIPWSSMTVPDPETPATGRVFEELSYGLVGISGESRSGDANGPYVRVLQGGGTNTVVLPPFGGATEPAVGVTPLPILGARPSLSSSAKTPFRPDVPCEGNEPPNLDSGAAAPPPEQREVNGR